MEGKSISSQPSPVPRTEAHQFRKTQNETDLSRFVPTRAPAASKRNRIDVTYLSEEEYNAHVTSSDNNNTQFCTCPDSCVTIIVQDFGGDRSSLDTDETKSETGDPIFSDRSRELHETHSLSSSRIATRGSRPDSTSSSNEASIKPVSDDDNVSELTDNNDYSELDPEYTLDLLVDSKSGLQLINNAYLYDEKTGSLYRVIIRRKRPPTGDEKTQLLEKLGKALSDAMEVSDSHLPITVRRDIQSVVFSPQDESIFCLTSSGLPLRLLSAQTKRILLPDEPVSKGKDAHETSQPHKGLTPTTNQALSILGHEREFFLEELERGIESAKTKKQQDLALAFLLLRDLVATTGHTYAQNFTEQQSQKIESAWRTLFRSNIFSGEEALDQTEQWFSSIIARVLHSSRTDPHALVDALLRVLAKSHLLHPELNGVIKVSSGENEATLSQLLSSRIEKIDPSHWIKIEDFYGDPAKKKPALTVGDLFTQKEEKKEANVPTHLLSIMHAPGDTTEGSLRPTLNPNIHFAFKNQAHFPVELEEEVIIENTKSADKGCFFPEKYQLNTIHCKNSDGSSILLYKKTVQAGESKWFMQIDNNQPEEISWENIQKEIREAPANNLQLRGVSLQPMEEKTYLANKDSLYPSQLPLEENNNNNNLDTFITALRKGEIELAPEDYSHKEVVFNTDGYQPLLLSNDKLQDIANKSGNEITLYEYDRLNSDTNPEDRRKKVFSPNNSSSSSPLEQIYLARETTGNTSERKRVHLLNRPIEFSTGYDDEPDTFSVDDH